MSGGTTLPSSPTYQRMLSLRNELHLSEQTFRGIDVDFLVFLNDFKALTIHGRDSIMFMDPRFPE